MAKDTFTEKPVDAANEEEVEPKRGLRFWLVFVALCCTTLLAAFDLGGISTAAPTMVSDLNGQDFSWVASGYSLSSAACIPLSGNLAQIFGRRPIALGATVIFAVGSAIAGSAKSMNLLILGRAIQGVGGGGIQAATSIIISDLVPLKERGLFQGITGLVWSLGTLTGPFIAGSLAERASWRWLFYMNIPLCAVAFLMVLLFFNLHTPTESLMRKLEMIDWVGNALITASTCSMMIGLTWGGTRYAWNSPRILVLLILGVVGFAAAIFYESRWPEKPTASAGATESIPLVVLSNRTSFAGYFATFMQCMVLISVACETSWFQSVKQASPITAAVYILPLVATIAPSGIIQGIVVSKTGRYRVLIFFSWCISLVGIGLLISIHENTPIGVIAIYQLLIGVAIGLLYATTFAVLAPLSLADSPPAVALLTFLRALAQAWGVTVGEVILQNALPRHLPAAVLPDIPNGSLAYSLIPLIAQFPEPLKSEVKHAFFQSMRLIWIVLEAFCAAGLISFFFMKDVPLRTTVDKKWGIKEAKGNSSNSETPAAQVEPAPTLSAPTESVGMIS
ncbi:MFS general substrate transporter [Mycena floridula]|nr:MFS general substrate transporter [Mycena floridula]